MGAGTCSVCHGTGYLLGQTYGDVDIPDGWTPVQRCDTCSMFDSDEAAAWTACAVEAAHGCELFIEIPADHESDPPLGDWAICTTFTPDHLISTPTKETTTMKTRNTIKTIAIGLLCIAPLAACEPAQVIHQVHEAAHTVSPPDIPTDPPTTTTAPPATVPPWQTTAAAGCTAGETGQPYETALCAAYAAGGAPLLDPPNPDAKPWQYTAAVACAAGQLGGTYWEQEYCQAIVDGVAPIKP